MEMTRDQDEEAAASHKEKAHGREGEMVPEINRGDGQQGMGPEGHTLDDKETSPWRWVRSEVDHMAKRPEQWAP